MCPKPLALQVEEGGPGAQAFRRPLEAEGSRRGAPPPRASRQNRPCRILTGAPEAHLGAWSAGLCANKLLLVKAAQQGSRVTAAENMNPCRFPLKQCEASRGLKLNPTECWCSSSK